MNTLKKSAVYLGLTLLMFVTIGVVPGRSRGEQVSLIPGKAVPKAQNINFPISLSATNPCTGELVPLSGTLYSQFQVTANSNTTFLVKYQINPDEIVGLGQTSGDQYQGTGVIRNNFLTPASRENALLKSFHVVGQLPGNDFVVSQTFHVTVNGKGQVTASVDNFKTACP